MNKNLFVGIDTSCYMTSLAFFDENGLFQYKKSIYVRKGECGLRQSEALFQHIKNLPELFEKAKKQIDFMKYDKVYFAASKRPRSVDGSYMPVFLAGTSFAKSFSDVFATDFIETSHQDGHIMAAVYSSGEYSVLNSPFISVHISGGTTEILLTEFSNGVFKTTIIGGTRDLPAGQFIDRIGVLTGKSFPAGKEMDECALKAHILNKIKSKICVNDGYINFSGEETKIRRLYLENKINSDETAFYTLNFISESIKRAVLNLKEKYNIENVIMAGGVSSSQFLRKSFSGIDGVFFASPEFSGDNAAGVCLIGKYFIYKEV